MVSRRPLTSYGQASTNFVAQRYRESAELSRCRSYVVRLFESMNEWRDLPLTNGICNPKDVSGRSAIRKSNQRDK